MSRRRRRNFWSGAKPLVIPEGPKHVPDTRRLMQAQNEYFTAGAVWERKDGLWRCIEAAPILDWMRKCTPESAKLELARRGCEWVWL